MNILSLEENAMVSDQLSGLLLEWTMSVIGLNISNVQSLLEKEPELLWTPIPHTLEDIGHLQSNLLKLNRLVTGIVQAQTLKLLIYLIEQATAYDLDTRYWGECNNSTLHLACFLDQQDIARLLMQRGVSTFPTNDLGYLPRDVCSSENLVECLANRVSNKNSSVSRSKSTVRPNYSNPDRFKLLRNLAEESTVKEHKTSETTNSLTRSETHYFRKGRVKETQQKVLSEEEVIEAGKQRRQAEVAQLEKSYAVKNNPLFRKLEKKKLSLARRALSNSNHNSSTNAAVDNNEQYYQLDLKDSLMEEEPVVIAKRNSKTISTLKDKSYVSTSVFVQADEETATTNISAMRNAQQAGTEILVTQQKDKTRNTPEEQDEEEEIDFNPLNLDYLVESLGVIEKKQVNSQYDDSEEEEEEGDSEIEDGLDKDMPVQFATRLVKPLVYSAVNLLDERPTQVLTPSQQQDYEEERCMSPIGTFGGSIRGRGSVSSFEELHPDDESENTENEYYLEIRETGQVELTAVRKEALLNKRDDTEIVTSKNNNLKQRLVDRITHVRPKSSGSRRVSSTSTVSVVIDDTNPKEKKRMSGSQKAAWTMSMSSWAAILDREFNLDEIDPEKTIRQQLQPGTPRAEDDKQIPFATNTLIEGHNTPETPKNEAAGFMLQTKPIDDFLSEDFKFATDLLSLSFTDFDTPIIEELRPLKSLNPPQIDSSVLSNLNYSNTIVRKPITSKNISGGNSNSNTSYADLKSSYTNTAYTYTATRDGAKRGKLYLHVNGIRDVLLPLPKERAYVRCVVSDGRFEYMSRYEILDQNIPFDYECVIDTHPNMIITISLHVRPDYIMKSRKPFSRLFLKKKKESLSGYVHKEDGAIGQARFALAHMIPVCSETAYPAGFHCFNAWYSKSFIERHRQKMKKNSLDDSDQNVLKVVGNYDVELLYLPKPDLYKPCPRSLYECHDMLENISKNRARKTLGINLV